MKNQGNRELYELFLHQFNCFPSGRERRDCKVACELILKFIYNCPLLVRDIKPHYFLKAAENETKQ